MPDTQAWVRQWLLAHGKNVAMPLASSDDLIAKGVLDSFGTIELISAVEAEFNVEFGAEDLHNPRFATLDGIAEAVQRNRLSTGGSTNG